MVKCQGCENEVAVFVLHLASGGVEEYYCPECMGSIISNAPEDVYTIRNITFRGR